jgi:hypothetical protein
MIEPLSTLNSAIDAVKNLQSIDSAFRNAEATAKIADLLLDLATLKTTLSEVIEDNRRLKAELALHKNPQLVTLVNGMYYDASNDGPFCTVCYDKDGKLIRLLDSPRQMRSMVGTHHCAICKARYGKRR